MQVQSAGGGPSEMEPLRVPSERPAPSPYAGPKGRPLGAAGATVPMPNATAPGNRSEERMIAVRPDALTDPEHAGARAEPAKAAAPRKPADPTRPMPGSASPVPAAPTGYKPVITTVKPTSGATPAASPASARSAAPAPPRASAAASPPAPRVAPNPAAPTPRKPRAENTSEPLKLSLDASDDMEGASIGAPPSRRGPTLAIVIVLLAGAALLAWMLRPSAETPVAPESIPTRNSAELAEPGAMPSEPTQAAPEPPALAPAAQAEVEEVDEADEAEQAKEAKAAEPSAQAPSKPAPARTVAPKPATKAAKPKPRKPVVLLKQEPVLKVAPKSTSTDDLVERAARAAAAAEAEERGQSASERNAPPPPPEPPSPD
jgi:hypothetical protein